MATQTFDPAKAEAFADRLLGILNSGAIAIMISIGHRTGLFDTLATLPPATSQAIATAANLDERYVREWLAAMVTGQLLTYDPATQTYALPAEHGAFLTRAAGSDNIATFAQYLPQLASVEDQIVACFQQGGGVPYAQFARFHEIMAEDSGLTVVAALEDHILPLVPGLVADLERGIDVLDLGCGRGLALLKLASLFPNSRFTGLDFSTEAIAFAQAQVQQQGLANIHFAVQDAATLNAVNQYDLITTFDAIHDQARPDLVLANIARALRPTGTYLMQDIRAASDVAENLDHPIAPFLYTVSCLHCMTVSLAVGGMGLGTMWGEAKALELLGAAGFTSVEIKRLAHDLQNNFYLVRRD